VSRRRAVRWAWGLLAVLAGWAGTEIGGLARSERLNAQIDRRQPARRKSAEPAASCASPTPAALAASGAATRR
jgi:hypothetical protein